MRERHVTREHYQAVERGEMTPEALKRLFREHVLELCPVCDGELEAYADSKRLHDLTLRIVVALLELIEGAVGRLDEEARVQLAELMRLPAEERQGRVARARKRFRNPILADLLIEASRQQVFADPREAAGLARLAFEVALRIECPPSADADVAHEPMTRALAYQANALRAGGDPRAADRPMSMALENLGKITTPGVQAEIVKLAASLRRAQRRFEDAHRLIDLSIQLDHESDEQHGAGEKMLVKSQIHYDEGRLGEAITIAQAALGRLDPCRDERSRLFAEHTLLCYLVEAGLFEQARQRFEELASVYERFEDDTPTRLRRWWLEGKIAQGTGAPELAESRLAAARDGFLAHGNGYDAALASLDLALLYEEQGRLDELQELADAILPIFRSQDVHREAAAALALFVKAASRKAARRPLIERLAAYLRQARQDETLRFEPPG